MPLLFLYNVPIRQDVMVTGPGIQEMITVWNDRREGHGKYIGGGSQAAAQAERDALELSERRRKVFTASLGEDPESVRPEYDYYQVRKEPDALADVDEERYHIYFVDKQLFLH